MNHAIDLLLNKKAEIRMVPFTGKIPLLGQIHYQGFNLDRIKHPISDLEQELAKARESISKLENTREEMLSFK